MELKTIHTIEVKYIAMTSYKGSRVKITSLRFDNDSKTIPYDYSHNTSYEMAAEYLTSLGFDIQYVSEGKNCYYLHTSTFKPIKG